MQILGQLQNWSTVPKFPESPKKIHFEEVQQKRKNEEEQFYLSGLESYVKQN